MPRTSDRSKTKIPGKASLQRVTEMAGVSASTVSRYLNGTAHVSEEKRIAIERAIQKTGFVADPIAAGLAGGKSRCIGVITQSLDSPFYGQCLLGIEDVLHDVHYLPLFLSGHWREEDERRCIAMLERRRVDGLIILTSCLSDAVLLDHSEKVPMVVTGRNLESDGLLSLYFDNYQGGLMATTHLIELGHRDIAFIKGTQSHPDAVDRYRGYRAALKMHGIPHDAGLVKQGNFVEVGGLEATRELLQEGRKFTAIFAANDQMAMGAALALSEKGLTVPGDVSLVGFDDLVGSPYFQPPLKTVRHSMYQTGRVAANAMLAMLGNQEPQLDPPKPELMVRSSTRSLSAPQRSRRKSS
jgi:LacI family transcriptional regulator